MDKLSIFDTRDYYKPLQYPWAFDYYEKHEKMHWIPGEVNLMDDIRDWETTLTEDEKTFLTYVFRFFTQMDVDVAGGYMSKLGHIFNHPELRMMMASFAAREAIHIHAYALLIDTLGLPETEFIEFKHIPAMLEKHNYLNNFNTKDFDKTNENSIKELLKCVAVYSGFTEGVQLFGSFSVLMNFQRLGKMPGMTIIVDWSIRDENVHVEGMTTLFREIVKEYKHLFTQDMKDEIYEICDNVVKLEIEFINLLFDKAHDNINLITRKEVENYIKFIADQRLLQLGLKKHFKVENPFEWMEYIVLAPEHSNFFERRVTEYTKGGIIWDTSNLRYDSNDEIQISNSGQ